MDTRISMTFLQLHLFFVFSLTAYLSNGSDSISPTQHLSRPHNLTYQGGAFELGFFTPGNSQKYYIGIWYKRVPQQTVVWVANREKPLPNTSNSILKIAEDGNPILLNPSNLPIWSTNLISKPLNLTVAVLLDTGNLILRDRSNSFWQSFDRPTHTWLPGGWLGLNKETGENQRLTSWKNSEDPATGLFSIEIDPGLSTQYFIMWNGTKIYSTTGNWYGAIFSNVPEMRLNDFDFIQGEPKNYFFNFINDEQMKYFNYSLKNTSSLSRLVIDHSDFMAGILLSMESQP